MSQTDDLRRALRHEPPPSRREVRAAQPRARILTPGRILLSILKLPIVAGSVAVSLYLYTSPFDPPQALAHLVARAGCDAAASVNLAPAYRGGLGYHARNDADGDGVACEVVPDSGASLTQGVTGQTAAALPDQGGFDRRAGGAKFVRP
jgi:excalibur calcium-binding domain-containing protein